MEGQIVNNKYIIEKHIGRGAFGNIFKSRIKRTGEPICIKLEPLLVSKPLLKNEATILNYLNQQKCKNVPLVIWYGIWLDCRCLCMPLCDISLQEYREHNFVSIEKANAIMRTCIEILENIHNHYVIHRDIKPHNFMLKNRELYLIDFGFSTFYIDDDKNHIPLIGHQTEIIGTPKYISYHIHSGFEPSRRDDLISIGYIYLFLVNGRLEWDNIVFASNSRISEISVHHSKNFERKQLKSIENLKAKFSETLPRFVNYISYCYGLAYEETPKYDMIKELFIENNINA